MFKRLPRLLVISLDVVAIGCVAWWFLSCCGLPKDDRRVEETGHRQLTAVTDMFIAEYQRCPQSLSALVDDGLLRAHFDLRDAWKRDRRFTCNETQFVIWSAGPDGRFDTVDDIKTTEYRASRQ